MPGVAVRFRGGVEVVACSSAARSPTQGVETFKVQPVEAVPVALSQADIIERAVPPGLKMFVSVGNPPAGPALIPCPAIFVAPMPTTISGVWLLPVKVPVVSAVELAVLLAEVSITHAEGLGMPVKSTMAKPWVVVAVGITLMVLLLPSELNPHQISPDTGFLELLIMRDQVTPPPVTLLTDVTALAMGMFAHRMSPGAGFAAKVAVVEAAKPKVVEVACWLTEMAADARCRSAKKDPAMTRKTRKETCGMGRR